MSKVIRSCVLIFIAANAVAVAFDPGATGSTDNPHGYFDSLRARSDYWKSYSMRDESQLQRQQDGGFAQNTHGPLPLTITYDPWSDSDPHAQDAAKVVVPAFTPTNVGHVLRRAVGANDTVLPFVRTSSAGAVSDRSFKIDDEIVTIISADYATHNLTVSRGQFGTTPAPHEAGTAALSSTNSVPTQVRFPLGLEEGYSYLLSWDSYWTDSYLQYPTHSFKTFQFSRPGDNIWFEVRTRFDGGAAYPPYSPAPGYNRSEHVWSVDARSYQTPWDETMSRTWTQTSGTVRGPDNWSGSGGQPVLPFRGYQISKANEWSRWYVQITGAVDDWDNVKLWVATESRDPVLIYDLQVSMMPASQTGARLIDKFWLEFNSSQVRHIRGDQRDLVCYVKNLVVLRNAGGPGSWKDLIVRPSSTRTPFLPGPRPDRPRNFRVLGDSL